MYSQTCIKRSALGQKTLAL